MNLKKEYRWLILIGLFSVGVYLNALAGDFVYDDRRQILKNELIKDASLYAKALTADVWAFETNGTEAVSNYYRPTFVLYLIVSFALFGADPFGWHVFSVILNMLVCLFAYILLRRIDFSERAAFALAAIFAVHPVHVENVSWISGVSDILVAVSFLGSLLLAFRYVSTQNRLAYVGAFLLYVLALGSKEIALLCFPVYYFFVFRSGAALSGSAQAEDRSSSAFLLSIPFAAAAAGFFVVRWLVIGGIGRPVDDAVGVVSALLTAPLVFLFYLRQSLFPIFLAENHPLRPVISFGVVDFLIPLIISAFILFSLWELSKRSERFQFGVSLFLLPLIPALFVAAFPSEQIVHDRYLYLPLLGLLIILGALVVDYGKRWPQLNSVGLVLWFVSIFLFSLQTISYNRVWASGLSLWEHNVKADPASSVSFANFGAELANQKRFSDAVTAYDRSLKIKPSYVALMGRARNLIALGRFEDAIHDLKAILTGSESDIGENMLYQAYEAAAVGYSGAGKPDQAEISLKEARSRLPNYRAALTGKLAIVLYNQGKKEEALTQLRSAREQAQNETLPESKALFFRLGMLESEFGNTDAAKAALKEYLNASSDFSDAETISQRRLASSLVEGKPR